MTKAGIIFSSVAIATLIGAVAVTVANGTLPALFSFIVTRPSIDRTQTPIGSAAPFGQPEVAQSGAIETVPAPRPAQLPAPIPSAPVSNDSSSGAKTAPVLDKTGSVPPAQAGGRVTAAEVFVPAAEKGLMPWRTALTAAEKAAVARGLKELENTAANSTPAAPAERAATAGLNRKFLADGAAGEARAKQLQAQYAEQVKQQQSQYDEQKRLWEKQQEEYPAQLKSAGSNP
jgi:hypothetical protein